jgi:NurA-like 5'-3' nuclease
MATTMSFFYNLQKITLAKLAEVKNILQQTISGPTLIGIIVAIVEPFSKPGYLVAS